HEGPAVAGGDGAGRQGIDQRGGADVAGAGVAHDDGVRRARARRIGQRAVVLGDRQVGHRGGRVGVGGGVGARAVVGGAAGRGDDDLVGLVGGVRGGELHRLLEGQAGPGGQVDRGAQGARAAAAAGDRGAAGGREGHEGPAVAGGDGAGRQRIDQGGGADVAGAGVAHDDGVRRARARRVRRREVV